MACNYLGQESRSMKVSVIIPTHNRLWQLQAAYDSACRQTIKPNEIIIIDDGSTLAITHYLLNTRKSKVPTTIKRFNQPQGACKARNYGIENASHEIVMFLDDDDTWEPEKIARQLAIFDSNPEIGLVYSGRKIVSEKNRDRILYSIKPEAQGKLYPDILTRNLVGSTSSVAVKKSILLEVGGFDESLPALQDYELWIRIAQETLIAHDNSCLVRYTVAENTHNQISGKPEKYISAGKIIQEKYREVILLQPLIKQRKFYAALNFFVARYAKGNNLKLTLLWSLKSFIAYPNLKSLLLLIPLRGLYFLKRIQPNRKSKSYLNLYHSPQSTK